MNQPGQITCHCIISHPTAAKFLAIKHADGWSPPVALLSDGQSIVGQVNRVNQGMMEHYGFMTVALRRLSSAPGYRCLELEMLSQRGRAGLQAVWVGKTEYSQFRRSSPDQFDPIAAWLDEKEAGNIPESRPPWEQAGWFASARDWIQDNLRRLRLQQSGPVEQYRAFRTTSSILRVPVGKRFLYFKACQDIRPREAALTVALAAQWPQYIDRPMVADVERNWMLSNDFGSPQQSRPGYTDYPKVARMLAEIQVGSLDSMERWRDLGCEATPLSRLSDFAARLGSLSGLLRAGGGEMALSEGEVAELSARSGPWREALDKLAGYDVPDMLIHPDVWFTNINRKPDGFSIFDWSGARLGHPFFSLLKLIRFRELETENRIPPQGEPAGDEALIEEIIGHYLGPFGQFETPQRLAEALALVREVRDLWRLFVWHESLAFEEELSPVYQSVVRHLQRIARQAIGPGEVGAGMPASSA